MRVFIIEFDAIAVILLGLTVYVFYSQKKIKDRASFQFELMLWVSLGSTVFDLISAAAVNEISRYGVTVAYATSLIFYLFHSTIPIAVAAYVMAISGKTFQHRTQKAAFLIPYLSVIILVLINHRTRFIFYFDENLRYRHGLGLTAPYIMVSIYVVFCLYLLRTRTNAVSQLARFALPGLFIIPVLAILLQNIFIGVLLECFAIAISMLLLLFTIQNSAELIDRECGVFNRAAFIKFAGLQLENRVNFDLILLCIQNESLLRHIYKVPHLLYLHQSVSSYLSTEIGKSGSVFYLEDGRFALLMNVATSKGTTFNAATSILKRFTESWTIDNMKTDLQAQICLLRCPDDAATLLDVFDCLEQMTAPSLPGRVSILRSRDLNLVNRKRQAEVEKVIVSALRKESLQILYQPIYSVSEKKFVFADTQIVLEDGNRAFIQQSELFRVAEHNGIMQKLGHLALDNVCSFLSEQKLVEKGIRHIEVRLSDVQCMQSDLSQQILSIMESHQIDPRNICLEITETAAVHAPEIMSINMKTLSSRNAGFALDDYGSGYTDLNYIMDIPFNLIKLDKRIVHAGFKTPEGRIAMECTIALIKRLNRNIVAEGVETEEHVSILTKLGCDYLQGFYFSKPLREKAFLKLLMAQDAQAHHSD